MAGRVGSVWSVEELGVGGWGWGLLASCASGGAWRAAERDFMVDL